MCCSVVVFVFPVRWCFNGGGDGWILAVMLSFWWQVVASSGGIVGFGGDCWLCGFDGGRKGEREERDMSFFVFVFVYII